MRSMSRGETCNATTKQTCGGSIAIERSSAKASRDCDEADSKVSMTCSSRASMPLTAASFARCVQQNADCRLIIKKGDDIDGLVEKKLTSSRADQTRVRASAKQISVEFERDAHNAVRNLENEQ